MRFKERIVALVLAVTIVAGTCACSKIDESAKDVCNKYLTSVASGDVEGVMAISDLSSEEAEKYFPYSYKSELVSNILAASEYSIDEEQSVAKSKDGTGKFVCTLSIPDYVAVEKSNPADIDEFCDAIVSASKKDVEVEIEFVYEDDSWKIANAGDNLDKIIAPLYEPAYDFAMDFDYLFSDISIDWLSGTAHGSISEDVTDAKEILVNITLTDDGDEIYDDLDLTFELSNVSGESYKGEPVHLGNNLAEIKVSSEEFTDKANYFIQDEYTINIYRGDKVAWSNTFDVYLTEYTFPSTSIVNHIFWQHADSSGSYFNTKKVEAKILFNDEYLQSGRDVNVTYNMIHDDEYLVKDAHLEIEADGYVCIYKSPDFLPTGNYIIEVYNNGVLAGSASVFVIFNLDPERFYEKDVAKNVNDSDDGVLTIYSGSTGAVSTVSKYSNVKFTQKVLNLNTFRNELDAALASGENAPDMFICDISYASYYATSDVTIPLNDIGIDYDEFRYMYAYTLAMGSDDSGVIKGVTWEINPGAVFYNRDVANKVFGVSEPEDIQPYYANWDAFLATARYVNEESNGNTKIICNVADIEVPYTMSRQDAWIINDEVVVSDYMREFFDLSYVLSNEDLTWGSARWSSEWSGRMTNKTVLSYYGSLDFGELFLSGANSHWGVVRAPEDYYDGGNYIFVTKYCDMDSSASKIIRDISINPNNLEQMASDGYSVNNLNIMMSCSDNDEYSRKWLDGQNPYTVFTLAAWSLNGRAISVYDDEINGMFTSCVRGYINGDYKTISQAENEFIKMAGEYVG